MRERHEDVDGEENMEMERDRDVGGGGRRWRPRGKWSCEGRRRSGGRLETER